MRVNNNPGSGAADKAQGPAPSNRTRETAKSRDSKAEGTQSETVGGGLPEISDKAKQMAKLKELANRTSDVREDKIAELKNKIASGKYSVDPEKIADKMVEEHLRLGGA